LLNTTQSFRFAAERLNVKIVSMDETAVVPIGLLSIEQERELSDLHQENKARLTVPRRFASTPFLIHTIQWLIV
jgi:tryptophanase